MSASAFHFRRHLSEPFVVALHELTDSLHGQWWRDALLSRDLVFAVRNDSLNLYHRGGSIFRCVFSDGRVLPSTHAKYLVRQRQAYADMAQDGRFVHEGEALWSRYQGAATLAEMIVAARGLAGPEKTGLHALITASSAVIDVEVAFRVEQSTGGTTSELNGGDDIGVLGAFEDGENGSSTGEDLNRQDRLDAVTLEERDGALWIVFHEAKHFANAELRASANRMPPVSSQIARYRQAIARYKTDIVWSYGEVCRALVQIDTMRRRVRQLGSLPGEHAGVGALIARAAAGEVLQVDPEPRLIVFGFDRDQRDGRWRRDRNRLKELGLTVYAIGNPKSGGATAFARQPTS